MLRSSQASHILNQAWHSSITFFFIIDVEGDDELDDSLEDEGNPSLGTGIFLNYSF